MESADLACRLRNVARGRCNGPAKRFRRDQNTMINEFKRQFQMVFEKLRDPLLLVDSSGYILDFNSAARSKLDIGDCEHIGDLSSAEKDFVFDADEVLGLVARTKPVYGFRPKNGNREPGKVTIDVINLGTYKGKLQLKLVHIRDVSPSDGQESWRDELVSMVAHEVRNPLAAMKNSMSILLSEAPGPVTAGQERLLRTAIRNIDRLTQLLDGFLDVSRINAGRYSFEPRWVGTQAFIADVLSSFQTLFNVQRQTLDYHVDPQIGRIFVDTSKLEQVLINLLNNAVKFTPEGGRISVIVEPHSREALDSEYRLLPWNEIANLKFFRVVVKDTGIGMANETLSHLFTRYHETNEPATGNHLGLAISKTLTEVQHGNLAISSRPGIGTKVTVSLPETEQTVSAIGRIKSAERFLARLLASQRRAQLYVIKKDLSLSWLELTGDWRRAPAINPTDERDGPGSLWSLGDTTAVALFRGGEPKSMAALFGPNLFQDGGSARHADGYLVGRASAPMEGSRFTPLFVRALARAKQMAPAHSPSHVREF